MAHRFAETDTDRMARSIDLNADLGEECADDEAMLDLVTTANIACGGHAGGGATMRTTIAAAKALGVAVGAHPSYPDRSGFGRRSLLGVLDDSEIVQSLADQIEHFRAVAQELAVDVSHIKPHGALYNDAMVDERAAKLLLTALHRAAPDVLLPVMGLPGSVLDRLCWAELRPYISEGFADRAYESDGTLMPRSRQGAVLTTDQAVSQARMLADNIIITADGTAMDMSIDSLCVHGDTPDAVHMAHRIREDLTAAGFNIRAGS
jgi:5-oxoprolinase (ATP-hydrolysing) subunit A